MLVRFFTLKEKEMTSRCVKDTVTQTYKGNFVISEGSPLLELYD